MQHLVFISYRRNASTAVARRLVDSLQQIFVPETIFMDAGGIGPGVKWEESLLETLRRSAVVLVLIDDNWVTATNADGQIRLHSPDDWVRQEVETALLQTETIVVPVILGGVTFQEFANLPTPLRAIAARQTMHLSDEDWDDGIDVLKSIIERKQVRKRALDGDDLLPLINELFGRHEKPFIIVISVAAAVIGAAVIYFWYCGARWTHAVLLALPILVNFAAAFGIVALPLCIGHVLLEKRKVYTAHMVHRAERWVEDSGDDGFIMASIPLAFLISLPLFMFVGDMDGAVSVFYAMGVEIFVAVSLYLYLWRR